MPSIFLFFSLQNIKTSFSRIVTQSKLLFYNFFGLFKFFVLLFETFQHSGHFFRVVVSMYL